MTVYPIMPFSLLMSRFPLLHMAQGFCDVMQCEWYFCPPQTRVSLICYLWFYKPAAIHYEPVPVARQLYVYVVCYFQYVVR